MDYLRTRTETMVPDHAIPGFLELEHELGNDAAFWSLGRKLAESMTTENWEIYFNRFSDRLAELDPNHPIVLLESAELAEDAPTMLGFLEKIIERSASLSRRERQDFMYILSDLFDDTCATPRGLSVLARGVEMGKESGLRYEPVLFRLAYLSDVAGRREQSIQCYTELTVLNPDEPTYRYNRACEFGILGRAQEASADLAIAIEMDPEKRDVMIADSYFDAVRSAPEFQQLLT